MSLNLGTFLKRGLEGLVVSVLVAAGAAHASATDYTVTADKSEIKWKGSKVVGDSHTGTVGLSKGTVTVEANSIKSFEIVVDMTAIANEDVKDPTYNKKLVDHLKSDDFFKVDEFKTATFKFAGEPAVIADGKATVTGELTIRGKTEKVTLPLTNVKIEGETATAEGTLKFDRTKFDVKYNSASFPDLFKVAKDKVIADEIDVTFKVQATAGKKS